MSSGTAKGAFGRKLVLGFLFAGLLGMLLSSVFYRLENPSRKMTMRQPPPASKAMPGMKEGNMDRMRSLMASLRDKPGDVPTLLELASLFMEMDAWDKAEIFLKDALASQPANPQALNMYGVALLRQKKHRESAEVFGTLVELAPDNIMAHYNLGVLYKHFLNDPAKARAHFQKALELGPSDPKMARMIEEEIAGHGN